MCAVRYICHDCFRLGGTEVSVILPWRCVRWSLPLPLIAVLSWHHSIGIAHPLCIHIYTYISHSIATSCRCSDAPSQQMYDAAMLLFCMHCKSRGGRYILYAVHDILMHIYSHSYSSYVSHSHLCIPICFTSSQHICVSQVLWCFTTAVVCHYMCMCVLP